MALLYLDSGVLIAANRPQARGHDAALSLVRGDHQFASSDLVQLEVVPKAVYHRQQSEIEFYHAFFAVVEGWARLDQPLVEHALALGQEFGLAGMDALHVAAAHRLGAAEFITAERRASPLLRVTVLPMRCLADVDGRS